MGGIESGSRGILGRRESERYTRGRGRVIGEKRERVWVYALLSCCMVLMMI